MFEDKKFEHELLQRLDDLIRLGSDSLVVQCELLKAFKTSQKLTEVVSIAWKNGGNGMPQKMPPGAVAQGFATCKVGVGAQPPAYVATLPNGPDGKPQAFAITSVDPASCTVAIDTPQVPSVDANGAPLVDVDGVTIVAFASFKVTALDPPAQPNVPIEIDLAITNSDGSVAASGSDTETVTEQVTEVLGDLILASTPPAQAKRK